MNATPSSFLRNERSGLPRHGGVRGWVARHPIGAFLLLAGLLAYTLMPLPALATRGLIPGRSLLARLPIAPHEGAGFLLTWGALLPATLAVTWAAEGREGLQRLGRRLRRWRVGVGWWLVVLLALPTLTIGLALLLGDGLKPVDAVPFLAGQLGFLAVNLFIVNLWEETAWAGFLQTRWERRHNLFVASLLTAVVFAFGHLPLAFFEDFTAGSLLGSLLLYFVLGVLFRPMLAVVLRGTGDSLLLVAVMHSVFNRTNNDNGIAAGLLDGESRGITMLVAVVVVTAATAVAIRDRLGRRYRQELDSLHSSGQQRVS